MPPAVAPQVDLQHVAEKLRDRYFVTLSADHRVRSIDVRTCECAVLCCLPVARRVCQATAAINVIPASVRAGPYCPLQFAREHSLRCLREGETHGARVPPSGLLSQTEGVVGVWWGRGVVCRSLRFTRPDQTRSFPPSSRSRADNQRVRRHTRACCRRRLRHGSRGRQQRPGCAAYEREGALIRSVVVFTHCPVPVWWILTMFARALFPDFAVGACDPQPT